MPKEEAATYIKTLGQWKTLIIGHELHEDGADHLHIYVYFKDKKNVKSPNHFDLPGNFHGNYQTVKNPNATKAYVKKSGDYIEEEADAEEAEEDLISIAKRLPQDEFFQHCMEKKIQFGYYQEARKLANSDFTIEESENNGGKRNI